MAAAVPLSLVLSTDANARADSAETASALRTAANGSILPRSRRAASPQHEHAELPEQQHEPLRRRTSRLLSSSSGRSTQTGSDAAKQRILPSMHAGSAHGSFVATGSILWNPVHSFIRSVSSLFSGAATASFADSSSTSDNSSAFSSPISPIFRMHTHAHRFQQGSYIQKRRPRRTVLNDAEFYGVDFGPPPTNDSNMALASARRPSITAEQAEREDKLRLQQGSVFISALNSMIVSRGFGSDSVDPQTTPSASVSADESNDKSGTDTDEMPSNRTSAVQQSERISKTERSQSEPQLKPVSEAQEKSMSVNSGSNPWINPVQQRMQQLDYSDVFPDDIGDMEGVTVFRIESLAPFMLDPEQSGKFCVADCYIVLDVRPAGSERIDMDTTIGGDSSVLEHHIFTWIGSQAEMDKKFCAAMYSVGLRNWIGATCRVLREVDGEESPEFLSLFGDQFGHDDITQATESGLFVAEEKRYPLRLYMLRGRGDIELCLIRPTYRSLRSDAVFLLDWGLEIFQWNGSKSFIQHRTKCRMICDRINKLERVGRAQIIELDESSESGRFWEILGREQTRVSNDVEQGQENDDEDHEEEVDSQPESSEPIENDDVDQDEDDSRFDSLIQSPQVLYRVFPKMAPELESHIVASKKLKRSLLVSDGCYILDAGTELFLWLGKEAWPQLRAMATELLAKVTALRDRPRWIGFTRCIDGHEPESFKLRFSDWDGSKVDKINWQEILSGMHASSDRVLLGNNASRSRDLSPDGKPKMRVDVKALYAPPPNTDIDSLMIEDTLEHANRLLQAFTIFVFHRGRFVQLPEGERGHFFSKDAYVFLCVYRVDEPEQHTEKSASDRLSEHEDAEDAGLDESRERVDAEPDESVAHEPHESDADDMPKENDNQDCEETDGEAVSELRDSESRSVPDADQERESKSSFVSQQDNVPEQQDTETSHDEYAHEQDDQNEDDEQDAYSNPSQQEEMSESNLESEAKIATKPVLECVVYFWEGRHASKLAFSTFKLKTLQEMEQLVLQMYESPVRVVHLQQGKEPIALLAHLDNMCVVRAGSRAEWLSQMEARAAQSRQTKNRENAQSIEPSQTQQLAHESPVSAPSGHVCALFHIRADLKYKTVRAIEVPAVASSLISRDCFLLQVLEPSAQQDASGDGETNDENKSVSRRCHYLWVGKGTSKEDVQRARLVAGMVLSFGSDMDATTPPSAEAFPDEEINLEDASGAENGSVPSAPTIETIAEKLEPRSFWAMLGGRSVYATEPFLTATRPPRFLRCSCSQGYFLVEEIPFFCQSDCQTDSCVILDAGAPHKLYVWTGSTASDVVRKLTRKSVEVWLDHLDDGRIVDFGQPQESAQASASSSQSDVVWVDQDAEPLEFRAFFHGWDARVNLATVDPGSRYLRQQQQERELKKKISALSTASAPAGA